MVWVGAGETEPYQAWVEGVWNEESLRGAGGKSTLSNQSIQASDIVISRMGVCCRLVSVEGMRNELPRRPIVIGPSRLCPGWEDATEIELRQAHETPPKWPKR